MEWGCITQVALVSYPLTEPEEDQKDWLEEHHMVLNPAPYYSQIDIVAAAGLSVRFGFNPGELADFLLGWFGVDIYHDDLSRQKKASGCDHYKYAAPEGAEQRRRYSKR